MDDESELNISHYNAHTVYTIDITNVGEIYF